MKDGIAGNDGFVWDSVQFSVYLRDFDISARLYDVLVVTKQTVLGATAFFCYSEIMGVH